MANVRTSHRRDYASTEDIERINQILTACVNLQRLVIPGGDDDEPGEAFHRIFRPLFILPNLRHLHINCTLDEDVLQFVQRHYLQLHTLFIIQNPCYGYNIAETRALNFSFYSRFDLPLHCSSISCSPSMASVFIPGSSITKVSLLWPGCESEGEEDVDSVASATVKVLAESAGPVQSINYRTAHWNFAFIQLVPKHLPQLTSLTIENTNLCFMPHGAIDDATELVARYVSDRKLLITVFTDGMRIFQRRVMEWFDENIASFKSLGVLRLCCKASVKDFDRTIEEDFELVRKWIRSCPTLVHCFLPSCQFSFLLHRRRVRIFTLACFDAALFPWVRLPDHDFCIPDTEYKDPSPGWRREDRYDSAWITSLFEKEGSEFAATWNRRCAEIQKSQCSWIAMEGNVI